MQAVYIGGSTPSSSPHQKRKADYGRRNMPRYINHVHPQIIVQRSREKFTEGDIALRDSIPLMSKCTAVICLLLNVILPGSGTLTAGLSVLCCSQVRPNGGSKAHCICLNAGVGLLQFLLTFLFLLGWIWSIMWGVAFLAVSKNYSTQLESSRSKPKSMFNTKTKVPHNSSHVRKIGSSRNNRAGEEIVKECNIHNHRPNNCHLQHCEYHTKHYQKKVMKTVAPEDFSCNEASIDPPDTSSLITKETDPKDATNPDDSPHECTLLEISPEISSLQESAMLQSRGHETSTSLKELFDDGAFQNMRTCRGIMLPGKTSDCSPQVTHRQTVVLHRERVHSSFPDVCQNSRNEPYQVCLTTVLK